MTHTLIDTHTLKVLTDHLSLVVSELQYEGDHAEAGLYAGAVATAQELLATPVRPIVVANITGGVLQGASSDYPLELYTLDFDCAWDDSEAIEVEDSMALCSSLVPQHDPKFVAEVVDASDPR